MLAMMNLGQPAVELQHDWSPLHRHGHSSPAVLTQTGWWATLAGREGCRDGRTQTQALRQARLKVARFQGYRDFYLARKFGITLEEARTIIKRIGKDRVKLLAATRRRKYRQTGRRPRNIGKDSAGNLSP
jgi:hypothetical protein